MKGCLTGCLHINLSARISASSHRFGPSLLSFRLPVKCPPSLYFPLRFNDISAPPLPPECPFAPSSFYRCQSPVLKLDRLARIDRHGMKNTAWCKFEIKVDNGIISVDHILLMTVFTLPSAPLLKGQAREDPLLSMTSAKKRFANAAVRSRMLNVKPVVDNATLSEWSLYLARGWAQGELYREIRPAAKGKISKGRNPPRCLI